MGLIVSLNNFDGFQWEWIDLPCSRWPQDAVGFIVHDLLLAHDLAQVAEWLLTISSRCLQLHDHPGRERQDTGEKA